MILKNKFIEDLSIEWDMEIADYMYPLIDMLTIEKGLLPLDYLASLMLILTKIIKGYRGNTIAVEDLYTEQRRCADEFFKFHTNNQRLFREKEPLGESYIREDHYYNNDGEIPVTFGDILEALNKGTDRDLSKDVNKPLYILITLAVHLCYCYYGYSKELEEDINELFYKYDQEILNYRKELEK